MIRLPRRALLAAATLPRPALAQPGSLEPTVRIISGTAPGGLN